MWTSENRARYDGSKLRYPSDVTDAEWALVGPLIPPAKWGGGKRTVEMLAVVNDLMYALSTGRQWRAIPYELPPKSTVHGYFDLWTYDGTLDLASLFAVQTVEEILRRSCPAVLRDASDVSHHAATMPTTPASSRSKLPSSHDPQAESWQPSESETAKIRNCNA